MPVSECRSETYPPSLFPAAGPVARSTPSRPADERLGWVSPPSFAGARPRDPGGARSLGSSSEVARKKNPGEISVAWAVSWLFSWLARGTGSVQRFSRCTFRGAALFGRVARARGDDVGRRRRTRRRAPDGISRGELTAGAWREVGSRGGAPGARRAFSFPVDAPGGGASTSPAPPAVPPPRGEGSAAAALQAADSWRDVLAASTLVVLPDEESVAWQRQRIHRKRRAGGAARALGRIARWLAARDKLGAGGEREQCVNDARFARLVAAAAAPTTEGGAGGGGGGGGARVDDDDDEEESAIRSSSVHCPHPSPPSSSLTAEERAGDVADALEALRALGSLAPLPWVDERHPGDPVAMRPRVSRLIQTVASSQPSIAPHDATPAAWACDRLGLFSGVNETNESNDDDGWDAATRRAGDVIARAAEGLPFKILPDLTARIAGMPSGEFGDSARRLDLDLDRELTVEALAAEVPFRAEKLVTRDGKRVDERRETCWMAEEGIGGLAYSGKVMSPAPFTPTIRALRDAIEASTGERFDCALLNLYPGGDVACKYHRDPDLGVLWARDSIIVSVGETRRFAFRELGKNEDEAHWFRARAIASGCSPTATTTGSTA